MASERKKNTLILKEKNLLLIFTRNPELGKCKTRLAATIGDHAALEVYKFLLNHTVSITEKLSADKAVYYSEKIRDNDIWSTASYIKYKQNGVDLGARMLAAFQEGFTNGYQHIIIIGSDIYDLQQHDIEKAFLSLKKHDYVIGPAKDGGYYLLGMNKLTPSLFSRKTWGTDSVLKDTLLDLQNEAVKILEERNDIDYYEDIEGIDVFQQLIQKIKK
ncbi:glycosyltransferase [Aquimarina sp. TRL1]|uniref:TIGR04282 family arsenosugar biosynthesis glycosyltransferase n=1 Tax=Aquimarina sp. (strain TRL1) TaxID=2736252 RepID=UPI00158CB6FC|nr:TIGR04282 family arsenosugar biosynthesis glycosyltransferase [Aquimarina sp. TRL1]QKX04275.1 glycosyltransferase [Aquimarina sp. TRL1]